MQAMTVEELRADVAALHHICRFNGHVKRHYSVAEHTAIGLEWMEREGRSRTELEAFCLHDLAEASLGLGDITRDNKSAAVRAIIEPLEEAYYDRLSGLLRFERHLIGGVIIKLFDDWMAIAEVETIATRHHNLHAPYNPATHGFAARRITEGSVGIRPRPRLEPWIERLFGIKA